MTTVLSLTDLYIIFLVIPVKTGIQWLCFWIPASAGMTYKIKVFMGHYTTTAGFMTVILAPLSFPQKRESSPSL